MTNLRTSLQIVMKYTFLLCVWMIILSELLLAVHPNDNQSPFKMNKFCCHDDGALFLWQLQHFMNMGCLSNTVVMAIFKRFLLKITANVIDKKDLLL